MAEIYTIPAGVCHAAPSVSAWIKAHVADPLVIGPDAESEQWVAAVAGDANAPFTVLKKQRQGDRDVEITVRDVTPWQGRRPVLVDDIISSGRTMEVAIKELRARGFLAPVVIGVHGILAEDAYDRLMAAGAGQVVTTNTVPHLSNGIDLSAPVAVEIAGMIRRTPQSEASRAPGTPCAPVTHRAAR